MMMMMKLCSTRWWGSLTLLALLLACPRSSGAATACGPEEWQAHPALCHLLQRAENDLPALVGEMQAFASKHGLLAAEDWTKPSLPPMEMAIARNRRRRRSLRTMETTTTDPQQLPVVLAHGMGDSCFNGGMQWLTNYTAHTLGVYAICIPTGKDVNEDTKNGYFLNWDASVDVFADAVAKNPELRHGFHAIGISQGNNVIRGYIGRYNTPAVHTFVSVNGPVAGVAAVPHCRPEADKSVAAQSSSSRVVGFDFCDLLMEQASRSAYTEFAQEHSFQANYWRDPRPSAFKLYQEYGQLAIWNNEAGIVNETLRENWSKTQKFVWIMAGEDKMVWPKEGEQWAMPDPQNPFHALLPMKATPWYQKDLFGLKTADQAGKNLFDKFQGEHCQFTDKDYTRWLKEYL